MGRIITKIVSFLKKPAKKPPNTTMLHLLRFRLTVVCTVSTAFILSAMAGASLFVSIQHLNKRGEISFSSDVNTVLYYIQSQKVLSHKWFSQTENNSNILLYLEDNGFPLLFHGTTGKNQRDPLIDMSKSIAIDKYGLDLTQPPASSTQSEKVIFRVTSPDKTDYYAAALSIPMKTSWIGVIILKSKEEEQQQILSLSWIFAGLVLLAVLGLGVFAWIFTGKAIQPIRKSQQKQSEFISAASHELRSPLAVIQTSISAMVQAPPPKAKRFGETITQECVRMSRLVNDLLLLAGADSGRWSVRREDTDMETLLLNAAESYEVICHQKGIRLLVNCPEGNLPLCRYDSQRINQVLSILLDNAACYTPSGGKVELSIVFVQSGRPHIKISVADTGPGVPEDQKEAIFERFYRADSSRTKKEHYGLGLSIASEIIALHKGKLYVEDGVEGGAVFIICLPPG